jgi:lysozyme
MSKLVEQLIKHEGLKLMPYTCTAGKLTIGVGRNIEDNGITEDEAMYLLHADIARTIDELVKFDWYCSLDEVRRGAIVNMCFNLGLPTLLKFTNMINAIKLKDYGLAAKEMLDSRWARQVGDRAVELSNQMRTGSYKL